LFDLTDISVPCLRLHPEANSHEFYELANHIAAATGFLQSLRYTD